MLPIYEKLYLLSVDDEKGVILSSAAKPLSFGLAGAVLAELALQDKIRISDKRRLEVIDSSQTGDKILDRVLQDIQASDKPRKLTYWVEELSGRSKKLRKRLENSLATKGVIDGGDSQLLGAVSTSAETQPGHPTKYELKSHLRAVILDDGETDLRSLALLNVARGSRLLFLIFTKDERRYARRCIHEKILREALGNPVAQTIEEIEDAVSGAFTDASG